MKSEDKKAKTQQRANLLSLEHVRHKMKRKLKHERMVLGRLTTKVSAMSKRLHGIKVDIHNERVKAKMLAQKYERENKGNARKWNRKRVIIEEKLAKAVHANRKLEKEIERAKLVGERNLRIARFRYVSNLRREKMRWRSRRHKEELMEKHLLSRIKLLKEMRNKFNHEKSAEQLVLSRLKAKVREGHRGLNNLRRQIQAVDRDGKIKLNKERARFNRMISQGEAKERIVKAQLAKLHAALIKEGIEERHSLRKVQSEHELRVARLRAKAHSKMHNMYTSKAAQVLTLREGVLSQKRKLVKERAHFTKELDRLHAEEKNEEHLRQEEILALKSQIKRIKVGTKLKVKNMDAKWKGKVAEWKKIEAAKLAKMNAILMHHKGQLNKEKLEVVRRNKEGQKKISSLKHELVEKNILYKKWLQKEMGLKRMKSVQIAQLKHEKRDIEKYLHILVVEKRAIRKSRKVQEKLARAVRTLKGKQRRWKLLQKKQAFEQGQLSLWTHRVVLIQQKIATESLKTRMFKKRMHHKFMQKNLELKGERSNESRLRHLWAKIVTQVRKVHAKLKTLKKRKAREQERISNEVAKVKRIKLKVKNVRHIILRVQMKVKLETLSLSRRAHLLKQREHKVKVIQGNLKRARSKFDVDGQRMRETLLHIKQQKHWNKQLNLKLSSLHKRLEALRKKEKRSLAHERHIKKELQAVERKTGHILIEMRSQEKKFKLGVQAAKNKEVAYRQHARHLIQKLTLKLNSEKRRARKLHNEKHALSHARARLLTWLKLEKGRRAKQSKSQQSLKKKLHDAVIKERYLESELKKQMKITERLKALLGCGKWRVMANHGRKYSGLLRKEGSVLSRLARELYHVERKVRKLTHMLKRGAHDRRTQAVQSKRELERVKRFIERARLMVREEKSHKW